MNNFKLIILIMFLYTTLKINAFELKSSNYITNNNIKIKLIKDKQNLNKIKKYITRIDNFIKNSKQDKLSAIYSKINKINIDKINNNKIKNIIIYLKYSIENKLIESNILGYQINKNELLKYYDKQNSRFFNDEIKSELNSLYLLKKIGDYKLFKYKILSYEDYNVYQVTYKNEKGDNYIISFLGKNKTGFDNNVGFNKYIINNSDIGFVVMDQEHQNMFLKEYSKIYNIGEKRNDKDFIIKFKSKNGIKTIYGEVKDKNVKFLMILTEENIKKLRKYIVTNTFDQKNIDKLIKEKILIDLRKTGKWEVNNYKNGEKYTIIYFDNFLKEYYSKTND